MMLGFNQGADQKKLPVTFEKFHKTEQHVHMEATVSLALLRRMAERNGLLDIYEEIEPYLFKFTAKNFNEFLTAYDLVSIFICTEDDVEEMVAEYLQRCKEEGLTHVAMTCSFGHAQEERDIFIDFNKDPKDYTEVEGVAARVREKLKARKKSDNLTFPQYIDAVARGIKKSDITTAEIILVLLRHEGPDKAYALLKEFEKYPHPDVTTIGLAGDEVNFPAKDFAQCFARARELGLKIAPHVCEHTPPKYLEEALTHMGPLCRVGHAITAPGDEPENLAIMERLKNLSNPAKYFLDQPGLGATTIRLLKELDDIGYLENSVDEENLKNQLRPLCKDEVSKECLEYLFQPLCIELSPTSNLLLIPEINKLQDHPLRAFERAGIGFGLNSDDPGFWRRDRLIGAEQFSEDDFPHTKEGCTVGMEWEKVQSLGVDVRKMYRHTALSMGCHKLLKIQLIKSADLYWAFHELKDKYSAYGNFGTNLLFSNYQSKPTAENARALLSDVIEMNKSLGGFDVEVKLAEDFVAKHEAFGTAVDAYQAHREADFLAFDLKMKAKLEVTSEAKREVLTY